MRSSMVKVVDGCKWKRIMSRKCRRRGEMGWGRSLPPID